MFPLTATGAVSRHRGKVLVGPVDLTMTGQGVDVLIGPNGSGKTTLLRLLHGTARLHAGRVDWGQPNQRAQAFVFQRPVMLRRSVLENLIYPLRLRGVRKPTAEDQARDWAGRVGLADMVQRQAPSLSGGEQQKLALARALITAPKVVFLDEPCAALDGRATREVEAILTQAKATGTKLILATHDMGQARRLADHVTFLLGGQVHETGPARAFFDRPNTAQAVAFLNGDIVE